MSASTSCLPEMNQPRPKSSFDLVRHAREKEAAQPPQREIFSDAPELTTDDENRLPGLHKNTTIKIDKKHKINQVGKCVQITRVLSYATYHQYSIIQS